MPIQSCRSDDKPGYRWGAGGKCYTYTAGDAAGQKRAKGKAIAQGVAIGDIAIESMQNPFLVTELQTDALTEGKAFDGFVAGDFVDMHGARILIEDKELSEYAEHTQAAIDSTATESGEIVGLAIDVLDHEKQDAAGWIVKAELDEGVIRLTPKWTKLGKELIENGIRRFFSATFNTANKVIMGGTLTNWPATRDDMGRILLRPIELSSRMFRVERERELSTEESLDGQAERVRAAWREQHPYYDNLPSNWVMEVFEDRVIVQEGAAYFDVSYNESDEGNIQFAEQGSWVKVRQEWIEAARDVRAKMTSWWRDKLTKHKPSGGDDMDPKEIKLDTLTPEQKSELALGLFAELAGESYDGADLGKRFNQLVERRATELVEVQTKKANRDQDIAEFSGSATGGDDKNPRGIPATREEVERFLGMLSDEALVEAKRLFGKIREQGLVEFAEGGHGRKITGVKELPKEYADKLDSGQITLEDLREPVLGLGDLAAYDLAKWKK
ncbi:MAG: phage protease [Acidimicrobiales bacterium]